ncbi:MAG TPA: molybdopterin-synthase adenylyltransferase MoeB [Candidatus Binataceae bacterium]|nr:molybdopterin-synthase adenylyltransferase MoeB [Candidatus Binataceae bacterium]
MAKTSKNILDEARAQVKQVDIDQARQLMETPGAAVIDVRESDEWRQGHLPDAIALPRGFLELRIEEKVPDRKTPLIVHCASGTRSLFAARTLREMGYENVYNMAGGFNAWKDRGLPWVADRQFTPAEITRYSRHFVIPEVGEKGQAKLLDARVLVLGMGALGSPVALYLAAAGIGTIGMVDFDVVDLSNLQRQIIHTVDRVGTAKTESAQKAVNALNPGVKVIRHDMRLTSENAMETIKDYDVIVNCGDNFPARYLINDACVLAGKPLVDGAIYRFEGNATVFHPAKGGPCYRCLYPEPAPPDMAPSCAEAGVLGALPGLIGSIEALETIKLIIGAGHPLIGRMIYFDTLSDTDYVRILKIKRDPKCPVCGDHPTQKGLIDYEAFCGVGSSPNGASEHSATGPAAHPAQAR